QERAVDRRGVDLDARPAFGERSLAREMAGGFTDAWDTERLLCRLLLQMCELCLTRLLGLHPRIEDEILPCEHHREGESDDEDEIAIVFLHEGSALDASTSSARGRGGAERRRRNWIKSFGAAEPFDRMAARQAPCRQREPFERAVHLKGLDRVLR